VLGLGAAAQYALAVDPGIAVPRTQGLATQARQRLGSIRGVRALDRGPQLCAITTYTVEGHQARDLVLKLRERGINTSAQAREDALIDLTRKGVETLLRVSPHYFNTEDEIETVARALERLIS